MNVGTAVCTAEDDRPWLHVRRELFEYGLLPFPSLVHLDGVASLQGRLLSHATDQGRKRVGTSGIAGALCLPEAQAHLVLDTLASVLPDDGIHVDSLSRGAIDNIDSVGADIDDLIVFLYIQNYRKLQPRPHRDAAAVADIWPSNSAFDKFLHSLSPLQMRIARRSVPFQAEEEAHQLTWVQKHLPSILGLLAEFTIDEDNETKVVAAEKFEHLGILFQVHDSNGNSVQLNQAAPFFANSDPHMPAAPVPLYQVLDWILEHICAASEHAFEKGSMKDNGPLYSTGQEVDVTMVDAGSSTTAPSDNTSNGLGQLYRDWSPERVTFVDAVTRASVFKGEADVKGNSLKVSNCHDTSIYVLAPFKYASVFGCSDSIIVLGPVGKALRVEHCERLQLVVPSARISIANCRECVFYLGVNQQPLILGDSHKLQVAPYNTFYPKLETHLAAAGVNPAVNRWDKVLTLGVVDPHDSVSHPAGIADTLAEGATIVHPDRYMTFMIPRFSEEEPEQPLTMSNPFLLPKTYLLAQQQRVTSMENLRKVLKDAPLSESNKRELSNAIHAHFRDWIYASGNVRHLYDPQL
ncbi:hypothetical protein O6H91_01G017200 [Diphasiastrum complanatum]|uniref:Uncharacterized protein n=2 Tax=Diphasiastrum complanatum TaxID=34168 RepID=A0ACC2ENI0_DIPCM|nr:hypothetical protein O6H91_01G017200 [Diphasiastrum complanatum]KAJ7568060.1 hypothetical protein O6H91_01G017200 [Diphasiastrum complanatum]